MAEVARETLGELSEEQKTAVFGGTAERFYRL
jgi:hypothetical protein